MNINKHIYYLEQLTRKKVVLVKEGEKETFFVPQDLEGRQEKYLQSIYRLLQQEVIDGDLILEDLPIKDLGRVKIINGGLRLMHLPITTLGNIKRINGDVIIRNCYNLENLGHIEYVNGFFGCTDNDLTLLKNSPKIVKGYFNCAYNKLTILQGLPKEIGKSLYCHNNKLASLEGCLEIVKGNFDCSNNNLTTLEGCPKTVYDNFYCYNNIKQFTKEEVEAVCNVKKTIHINK